MSDYLLGLLRAEHGQPDRTLIAPGNIDLQHRPHVRNPDGSISTVRSITVGPENGQYILLPTVIGHRVVSNHSAMLHYLKTGRHLGIFTTEKAADRYARKLHHQQEAMLP